LREPKKGHRVNEPLHAVLLACLARIAHIIYPVVPCVVRTCSIHPARHTSLVEPKRTHHSTRSIDCSDLVSHDHTSTASAQGYQEAISHLDHAWLQICRDPRHDCHTILSGQCQLASNNRRIASPLGFVWQHFQLERKRTVTNITNITNLTNFADCNGRPH
jgi:hypothetical protein